MSLCVSTLTGHLAGVLHIYTNAGCVKATPQLQHLTNVFDLFLTEHLLARKQHSVQGFTGLLTPCFDVVLILWLTPTSQTEIQGRRLQLPPVFVLSWDSFIRIINILLLYNY